jgi:hypothetical protein
MMNLRELVDHIHRGPAALELFEPLPFRRRTLFNPCDFNTFLQALQFSETIRCVKSGTLFNPCDFNTFLQALQFSETIRCVKSGTQLRIFQAASILFHIMKVLQVT